MVRHFAGPVCPQFERYDSVLKVEDWLERRSPSGVPGAELVPPLSPRNYAKWKVLNGQLTLPLNLAAWAGCRAQGGKPVASAFAWPHRPHNRVTATCSRIAAPVNFRQTLLRDRQTLFLRINWNE